MAQARSEFQAHTLRITATLRSERKDPEDQSGSHRHDYIDRNDLFYLPSRLLESWRAKLRIKGKGIKRWARSWLVSKWNCLEMKNKKKVPSPLLSLVGTHTLSHIHTHKRWTHLKSRPVEQPPQKVRPTWWLWNDTLTNHLHKAWTD